MIRIVIDVDEDGSVTFTTRPGANGGATQAEPLAGPAAAEFDAGDAPELDLDLDLALPGMDDASGDLTDSGKEGDMDAGAGLLDDEIIM